jgi:hypothetical protein
MTRLYGRAPRGEWVIDAVPQNYGQNLTMLGALSIQSIEAVMTVESATDVDVFLTSVEHMVAPTLKLGDVVVMDNLRAHKVAGVQQAIEGCGTRLIDLLPIRRICHLSNNAGRNSRPLIGQTQGRAAVSQQWPAQWGGPRE